MEAEREIDIEVSTGAIDDPATWQLDAASAMAVLRSLVGFGSWVSPALSWGTFGLGVLHDDAGSALATRLFGVRDFTLGLAVKHPDPAVRRGALQAGVMIDSIDVVATLMAVRRGAPKSAGVLVGGGAALFVAMGLVALAETADGIAR
ncbi:MAG: hypothetical protein ACR2QE_02055 [Acidimicrobiales bacterium]